MDTSNIKIVKTVRVCPYNAKIQSGESDATLLYDYHILDNAELTAMFKPYGFKRGYQLCDRIGKGITLEKFSLGSSSKPGFSQKEFKAVYEKAKADGLIPTQADIDQRLADEEKKREEGKQRLHEEHRKYLIHQAGQELYAACKETEAFLSTILYPNETSKACLLKLQAAISLADNGPTPQEPGDARFSI